MRFVIITFICLILYSFNQAPDGQKLFREGCAPCHHPVKQLTGPPFQRIRKYYSEEQLLKFMHHPPRFIVNDKRMEMVKVLYGGVVMPAYPYMKATELRAILDYVDGFPYDSLSPVYAYRRFTVAQQDSVLKNAITGSVELTTEWETVEPDTLKNK